MRGPALVAMAVAAIVVVGGIPRAAAEIPKPAYGVGDFWAYRTNLTADLGLALDGTSRIELVRFGSLALPDFSAPIAEFLVSGGGTFSGTFPQFGNASGTWTITGSESWETGSWKSVRSFLRLAAEGDLTSGPTPIPFALSLTNETTRRTLADGWPWPVAEGVLGDWTARWNTSQNITISVQGVPAGWNASRYESTLGVRYAHLRTEAVAVAAGTFDTHVVREEGPEGGSRLRWYAPRAGNDVLQEEFNETGERIARSELLAYGYTTGEPAQVPWLLGINLALGGVAVGLLVAIGVKRRRTRIEVWMPPEKGVESEGPGPLP